VVALSEGVFSLSGDAFRDCSSLELLAVASGYVESEDDDGWDSNWRDGGVCGGREPLKTVMIGAGCMSVGLYAFAARGSLVDMSKLVGCQGVGECQRVLGTSLSRKRDDSAWLPATCERGVANAGDRDCD
jgi:hypothetical protein